MLEIDALPDAKQHLATVLTEHGILPTAQRIEIAAILLARLQHLSAEQVLAKTASTGLTVSKATVYNTLGLFVDRGLVRQVIVDSTRVFYDSNITPHYHFYNVDDGTLTDVAIDDVPIARLPSPPDGTAATGVDIVMRVRNQKLL